ncbi:glycosyl transferase family 52 [Marinobacter sp. LV10R520-4]|uniref:glycosyltransferase family 52 n=1 Tax=Marinobacter sp. LV10R520-4 TaxID=1761796 RepID=UPI000BF4EA1D|nr:glycosyltransferase family 52 [Marinobacter sp. LV10R520-4]PFG53736.1 glycosyl transferase family 52 [Marinobacter sp. LV10R520-4]
MASVSGDCKNVLLLVRTPFQAWLANKIIDHIDLSCFDLVYFTYDDSKKDRFYFSLLSSRSRRSAYVNVRGRRRVAIHHAFIYLRSFFGRGYSGYNLVLLASFDVYLFRMLARRQHGADIRTFDDGAANIYPESSYYSDKSSRFTWLYDFLLSAGSKERFKKDIKKHYTIYPLFENIVEKDRVEAIDPWQKNDSSNPSDDKEVIFFIGQPFDEVVSLGLFDRGDLIRLEQFVKSLGVDYYLQHPREMQPLSVGGVLVSDANRIAEELIPELCDGKRPVVYGWFSTVLFNLPTEKVKKIYLSVGKQEHESLRVEMCIKVGCEIQKISDLA